MTIDKQALREELSNPAIGSKDHLRKLALALLDELDSADGYASAYEAEKWHYHGLAESEGERADRAEKALEAAEQERENWRVSFYNERFRADKLAAALNAEHEQHVMASSALITQHVRANRAESRIAELEARTVNLPKRRVGEVMHLSGFSRDYAEGWCAGNDNAIHEIRTAGIKVKES
ncbi:ead/Ea22-like family protein [Salmonella enterica]|nr:ead/Ea22-like family protein [Salmonella enterica subsp. enterica serovar Braenderup]EBJ8038943.1 ead/Ea22-like family protein [Salmonella enterica]EBQ9105339.1 hypothetical protein [Salmonella enterica subsp. enterica serovar Tennessee]EIX8768461.1 ead/Ea22-like family protein [Salmonella enterica subsp. enterica serovar Orion]EBW6850945.1 ead/Ea22-like family protein [Salmonella enterica subsp. enterica serovar Braenderup]